MEVPFKTVSHQEKCPEKETEGHRLNIHCRQREQQVKSHRCKWSHNVFTSKNGGSPIRMGDFFDHFSVSGRDRGVARKVG